MWDENNWRPTERINLVQKVIVCEGSLESQSVSSDMPLKVLEDTQVGPTEQHRAIVYSAPLGARVVVETHRAGSNTFKQYLIVD